MSKRELIAANRALRLIDDSDKWPICGKFNVTNRAIRRFRSLFIDTRVDWDFVTQSDYMQCVDNFIGQIVNGELQ